MPDSQRSGSAPELRVRTPDGRTLRFTQSFHIGRDHDCEVQVDDGSVSRRHAVVTPSNGRWSIHDLQSRNGLFIDGRRHETADIDGALTLTLGGDGPELTFEHDRSARTPASRTSATRVTQRPADDEQASDDLSAHYFQTGDDDEGVGGRTLMIRRAFQVQRRQMRRHQWIIAALVVVALCAAGYALYGYRRMARQEGVAEALFYQMKSLDMNIARIEQLLAASGDAQSRQEISRYAAERRQLENNYDEYVASLYDRRLPESDRLILKVTRIFGECEIAAPPDYLREVRRYIAEWRKTQRLANAIKRARDLNYTARIAEEFVALGLPPQFFYLALQETDFEAYRSGPPTRWGIAKGMWQFIPETGARFGLAIGPLSRRAGFDPRDDRFNWQKATVAAARYVKEIYNTDAQASGLLVMASYNWGERRVIDWLRTMPANPRERNFWEVLGKHRSRLPDETYNYVLMIVSAAVIGENPRLFGFPFDNPLAGLPATAAR
jgi:membrane-bound lytic murein transglycosylase D